MAVYTPLSKEQIEALLLQYDCGKLVSFEGIVQGVENTNYKIKTEKNLFILTIFEQRTNVADLPFFFDFMMHLESQGIYCSFVIPDKNGKSIQKIYGKSAAIFYFLEGKNVSASEITPILCFEMGELLARMHLASMTFKQSRANSMSLPAWKELFEKIKTAVIPAKAGIQMERIDLDPVFQRDDDLINLMASEIKLAETTLSLNLPKAVVHADAFPDNIFVRNSHIEGVIDFYFSATDYLAYDLAITLNSWCFENGTPNYERMKEFISGYETVRVLSVEEKNHFSEMARAAALRILMTRSHDLVFHDPKNLVKPKDPLEYKRILEFHGRNQIFS